MMELPKSSTRTIASWSMRAMVRASLANFRKNSPRSDCAWCAGIFSTFSATVFWSSECAQR